jgi:hypothetical protein
MKTTVRRIAVLVAAAALTACGSAKIPPVAMDDTGPAAKLDLYGIPSDGSYSPPPYEDVNSMCCAISRKIPPIWKVDLVASGEDTDGGIRSITITANVFLTCKKGDFFTGEFYHDVKDVVLAKSDAPTTAGPVGTFLVAQISVRPSDFDNHCRTDFRVVEYQIGIAARAENLHGGTDVTKTATLVNQ